MCPIPLFGLTGALLGGLSLRRIAASRGMLTGGAPAKVAVIIGLIVTAGQLFIFFGFAQAWTFNRKQLHPAMVRAIEAIELGDINTSPPIFTTQTSTQLTPERLEAVRTFLLNEAGSGMEVRINIRRQLNGFRTLFRWDSVRPGGTSGADESPGIPCTIHGDRADLLAWVFFDAHTMQPGNVLVTDVMVQLPDGAVLTLLPDGPAQILATTWLEWDVHNPEETSD
jgi:hypothetical protein